MIHNTIKKLLLTALIMICFASEVLAQNPLPEIPDRTQCDSMANKPGRLNERYPSKGFYYGCLVSESVPTLLLEAQSNIGASSKLSSKSLENTSPEDFIKAMRTAENKVNTGLYAAQYAITFLKANTLDYSDVRKRLLEIAELEVKQAETINKIIKVKYTRLDALHPSLELDRLKNRLTTIKYCDVIYTNYKTGKMKQVERSFLFPQSYKERVYTCAGVGINFYDLLFSSRMLTKGFEKMRSMCELNPEWTDICKDL